MRGTIGIRLALQSSVGALTGWKLPRLVVELRDRLGERSSHLLRSVVAKDHSPTTLHREPPSGTERERALPGGLLLSTGCPCLSQQDPAEETWPVVSCTAFRGVPDARFTILAKETNEHHACTT